MLMFSLSMIENPPSSISLKGQDLINFLKIHEVIGIGYRSLHDYGIIHLFQLLHDVSFVQSSYHDCEPSLLHGHFITFDFKPIGLTISAYYHQYMH